MNFWTSLRDFGVGILSIALIFSGLASMSRLDTRKPSNFPAGTPNVHFVGFNFMRYFRKLSKVSLRSSKRVSHFFSFYDYVIDIDLHISTDLIV